MFTTQCHYCGKTYDAKRRTSKYCSAKCRVQSNRVMRTNAEREIGVAYDALKYLNGMSDHELNDLVVSMERMLSQARRLVDRVDSAIDD